MADRGEKIASGTRSTPIPSTSIIYIARTSTDTKEPQTLVHDLWTLRLQHLQHRVPHDDSETEAETHSQFYSSQSEPETSASESTYRKTRARSASHPSKQQHSANTLNLLDTLTLCYTGLLLLREPITIGQIQHWCQDGGLLYYRAWREVPLSMRERLPAAYQELLEPQPFSRPERLHDAVLRSLKTMHAEIGMVFPAVNHVLISYRWVRELALPIEVFAATERLARVLGMGFTFTLEYKVGEKGVLLRYPEVRLMALLIVVVKLLFPLDEVARHPVSAVDVSALAMDWRAWAEKEVEPRTQEDRAPEALGYAGLMGMGQHDVLDLDGDHLDQYMDWFEENIASEEVRERGRAGRDADFRRTLFKYFPVHRTERALVSNECVEDAMTDRLRRAQTLLVPNRIVGAADESRNEEVINRMGSFYKRDRTPGDLTGFTSVLYTRCSGLVGCSVEGMVKGVSLIEGLVQKDEEKRRKEGS
ncbi:hypothetical protein LTR62_004437 [Meristemomyces frigidus]|uniref:Uncharacterized protein n=1 Tax=Meristemomyces frigidus TaxID=1508187 RepID=A0AAN7YG63_9PEZI|nr:hypothetical protein LTR62_004437 [Meristemomyces frigidus]